MKDGSAILKFKEGQITSVFINAGLDSIYERIFRNAQRNAHRNPAKVVYGIKVLIFGCFWLESCCNNYLKCFLDNWVIQKNFRECLWETLKRANILNKFEIISAFANKSQLQKYEVLLPGLKRAFDLRNRMAHFKDKDFQIADSVDINKAMTLLSSAPDPELIQELKGSKIKKHAEAVAKSGSWLNVVYRRHFKDKSYPLDKSPNTL